VSRSHLPASVLVPASRARDVSPVNSGIKRKVLFDGAAGGLELTARAVIVGQRTAKRAQVEEEKSERFFIVHRHRFPDEQIECNIRASQTMRALFLKIPVAPSGKVP